MTYQETASAIQARPADGRDRGAEAKPAIRLEVRQCGEVAVGCSDAAGVVERVATSISGQITILNELQAVMASLETDQRQVTDATDEARLLAESARTRLAEGGRTIAASIDEFGELTALVLRLGHQISGFASAMQQVRRTGFRRWHYGFLRVKAWRILPRKAPNSKRAQSLTQG